MVLRPTWAPPVLALAGGAALAALPPTLGFAALLAGGSAVLALVIPASSLGGVILAVPFSGLVPLPAGGGITATEAAVALVVGTALAMTARERVAAVAPISAAIPIAVLLGAMALATAEAQSLTPAIKELVKWGEFVVLVLVTPMLVRTLRHGALAGMFLVAVAALEAGYGVWQVAAGAGPAGFLLGGHLRAFGHFGQPNPYAAYLATGLLLAAGMLMACWARGRPGSPSLALVAVLGATALLIAYGLAASFSRSAAIGLVVAGASMLAVHDRRLLGLLAAAGAGGATLLALGAAGLLPEVVAGRFGVVFDNLRLFDPREVTLTSANFPLVQRMAIWQAAWDMSAEYPFLGVGPGNFDIAYRAFAIPGWPQLPGHAHNYYLNLLAEGGALLLTAYLLLLGWLGVVLVRAAVAIKGALGIAVSTPSDTLGYGLSLGAVGVLAFVAVHHLFDSLYVHGVLALVGLIFGLALAAQRCLEAGAPRQR